MKKENKFLLVSVNMGYGHQRTAFPLRDYAHNKEVIMCNDYENMPQKDRKIWENSRKFYEFVSRAKKIPLIGEYIFSFFDKIQEIEGFYPRRDLSSPNFMVRRLYKLFKKGWGKDFIEKYNSDIPMINTFFVSAFMAEFFGYKGEIFCTVCDADISRSWAPLNPKKSKIKYFATNSWTRDRLKMYGVREENIFLTGYPLPFDKNKKGELEELKKIFKRRLFNLDPERKFYESHKEVVENYFGKFKKEKYKGFTIAFSIGGAGAQKEIAIEIIKSILEDIKKKEVNIVIMAGIRREVKEFFEKEFKILKIFGEDNVKIVYDENIENYFGEFNKELKKVDIIWTKPSELSFYSALCLPILIAPTIGSQEDFNKRWLIRVGGGIEQENPKYAKEWMFDYLKSGRFAECLMRNFVFGERDGTSNIKKICLG